MKVLMWLGVSLACAGVQAQTVYRCGPDGRMYSQAPCPQGKAVDVSDPRSDTQRAAAQARTRDDQALGDALERERLDREAGKPAAPVLIDGGGARPKPVATASKAKVKASNKKKPKGKPAPDDDFKAVSPAKKTKAG